MHYDLHRVRVRAVRRRMKRRYWWERKAEIFFLNVLVWTGVAGLTYALIHPFL